MLHWRVMMPTLKPIPRLFFRYQICQNRIRDFLSDTKDWKIVKDSETEVWSICWGWSLIQILWPEVWAKFGSWSLVEILKLNFGYFGESTQPLGPLCLWQCFRVSLILWWHLSLKVLLCVASNYQFMEFIDIIPDIGVKPLTLRVTLTPILAFIRPSFHHLYRTHPGSGFLRMSVTH